MILEPKIREEELPKLLEEATEANVKVVHDGPRTVETPMNDYVGLTDIDSCAGLLAYEEDSKNILAAHLKIHHLSNGDLRSYLKRFNSISNSKQAKAYIMNGNSDHEAVVETTIQRMENYSELDFEIYMVDAENGTEGEICVERETGRIYDFRPSEDTIKESQKLSPI